MYPNNININEIKSTSNDFCSNNESIIDHYDSNHHELELFDWISLICPTATKKKLNFDNKNNEYNIFVPELNLAIEYCNLNAHNEIQKGRKYHFDKMKFCNQHKIRLITIFEDEWIYRKNQVKGFLLSVFNKNKHIVYARKCTIDIVDKKNAVDFLKKHHIQGSSAFIVAFGLYYNDELLAIITGNQHHRQGHEQLFVLNRLAFKYNYNVIGGSSKLLKKLIEYSRSNGYEKIISWSDNRWSEGKVYKAIGFELFEELGPDYSYVNNGKRESKQSNKKKNLTKKGATGLTEYEMAFSIGLIRIYDCGKMRWEINLI